MAVGMSGWSGLRSSVSSGSGAKASPSTPSTGATGKSGCPIDPPGDRCPGITDEAASLRFDWETAELLP